MTSRPPFWCPETLNRRPCWCPKPILWELNSFLMQTLSSEVINMLADGHMNLKTLYYNPVLSNLYTRIQLYSFQRCGLKTEGQSFDNKRSSSKEFRVSQNRQWRQEPPHHLFNKLKIHQRHPVKLLRYNSWITSRSVAHHGRANTTFIKDSPTTPRDTKIIRSFSTTTWMLFQGLSFPPPSLVLMQATNNIFLIWETLVQCQATWPEID